MESFEGTGLGGVGVDLRERAKWTDTGGLKRGTEIFLAPGPQVM